MEWGKFSKKKYARRLTIGHLFRIIGLLTKYLDNSDLILNVHSTIYYTFFEKRPAKVYKLYFDKKTGKISISKIIMKNRYKKACFWGKQEKKA